MHEGVGTDRGGVISIMAGVHHKVDGSVPVFAIWVRLVVKTYFSEASGGGCMG